MNDDRFQKLLRESADEYNVPPTTPSDAMWSKIQSQRKASTGIPEQSQMHWWRKSSVAWPAVAAAVLVIGIGIGRFSVAPNDIAPSDPVSLQDSPSVDSDQFYRLAAARHLQQTETLITLFTLDVGGDSSDDRQRRIDDWAKRLLSDTRLLLDSPAAEDPVLEKLLTDLEFVLARIAQVSDEQLETEQRRIADDALLMRLRSQLPAGRV